jgi:hypothetical protein
MGERNARRQVAAENGQVGRSTQPTISAHCHSVTTPKVEMRTSALGQASTVSIFLGYLLPTGDDYPVNERNRSVGSV